MLGSALSFSQALCAPIKKCFLDDLSPYFRGGVEKEINFEDKPIIHFKWAIGSLGTRKLFFVRPMADREFSTNSCQKTSKTLKPYYNLTPKSSLLPCKTM